jgi:ABC-type glycerol-3-phosphate transport system permease component
MQAPRRSVQLLAHAVLIATTLFVLFPYAWMLVTSIKPIADVVAWPVRWLPRVVTLENYAAILGDARFLRSLFNSTVVSVAVTAISVALAVPAAYGLTRLVRGGGRPMLVGILASQFFPPMVFFVPFYIMLQAVGLLNTLPGLIFAYLSVTLPICTWMVATSLRDIPAEIEEAARIDGCGDLRILRSIILPIATPGIVTAAIFAFILSWQEYIFALLYTTSERAQTAPVLMYYLLGQHQIDYARLMAAAVLLSIPIAVPFAFIQRYYRAGMTEGGLKG